MVKQTIPKALRIQVWNTTIGETIGKAKCKCCDNHDITQMNFECGHIVSEHNGGEITLSNLLPICASCNRSMGTNDLYVFRDQIKGNVPMYDKNKQSIINNIIAYFRERTENYSKIRFNTFKEYRPLLKFCSDIGIANITHSGTEDTIDITCEKCARIISTFKFIDGSAYVIFREEKSNMRVFGYESVGTELPISWLMLIDHIPCLITQDKFIQYMYNSDADFIKFVANVMQTPTTKKVTRPKSATIAIEDGSIIVPKATRAKSAGRKVNVCCDDTTDTIAKKPTRKVMKAADEDNTTDTIAKKPTKKVTKVADEENTTDTIAKKPTKKVTKVADEGNTTDTIAKKPTKKVIKAADEDNTTDTIAKKPTKKVTKVADEGNTTDTIVKKPTKRVIKSAKNNDDTTTTDTIAKKPTKKVTKTAKYNDDTTTTDTIAKKPTKKRVTKATKENIDVVALTNNDPHSDIQHKAVTVIKNVSQCNAIDKSMNLRIKEHAILQDTYAIFFDCTKSGLGFNMTHKKCGTIINIPYPLNTSFAIDAMARNYKYHSDCLSSDPDYIKFLDKRGYL